MSAMRGLAGYIMAGKMRAVLVVVAAAVLALVFPPLILVSGAALALVTLRLGASQGLTVLLIAAVLVTIMGALASGSMTTGVGFGLFIWVPILIMALLLRYTVSLGLSLLFPVALGMLAVIAVHVAVPEIDEYWLSAMNQFIRPVLEGAEAPAESINALFAQVAPVMTGRVAAWIVLLLALMLLTGRWWQALLYNPGGFREEFRELRLGMPVAILSMVLVVATFVTESHLLAELATVSLVMFLLQGIAIVHVAAAMTPNATVMLIIAYGLLLFIAPVKTGLMALGVIDSFIDIRKRINHSNE